MGDWWDDFNEELQKSLPFMVFVMWVITVAFIARLIAKGG